MPVRSIRRRLTTTAVAALVLPVTVVAVGLSTASPAAASGCPGRHAGDIDDDGHADLVVGSPFRSSPTVLDIGSVNVVRGSSTGLTTTGNQYLDETGISVDTPAQQDYFGMVDAVGFFNSDCFADVAVAVPGDDGNRGGVVVVYGSATGLVPSTAQKFSGTSFDPNEFSFGFAIAAGDFNGDGIDDLAVGAPNGDLLSGTEHQWGGVGILYGTPTGLSLTGHQWFVQGSGGVPGTKADGHAFGNALAAGDFNGDGDADLAIGAEGDQVGSLTGAGSVTVLRGSAAGLTTTGAKRFSQNTSGVPGTARQDASWGSSLATGDITGDGRADLVVGDPFGSVGGRADAGTITVLDGSATGITATGSQLFDQNTAGVPGSSEKGDDFGWAVAVGDFNGDGHGDVAVGVPNEGLSSTTASAGMIDVLYGAATGLTVTGAQGWDQNSAGIAGTAEKFDSFGESLYPLNIAGGATSALVVGVDGESSHGFTDNGGVNELLGSPGGLTATGNAFIDGTTLVGGAQNDALMSDTHIP